MAARVEPFAHSAIALCARPPIVGGRNSRDWGRVGHGRASAGSYNRLGTYRRRARMEGWKVQVVAVRTREARLDLPYGAATGVCRMTRTRPDGRVAIGRWRRP